MKAPITIGEKVFKYKKGALQYFKTMLNSYNFGDIISKSDQNDIVALLLQNDTREHKVGSGIKEIRIAKVQFGTKCFEIVRNDNSIEQFSYTLCINGDRKPLTIFNTACRNSIYQDLRSVKQAYFDKHSSKGKVKCQETGILSSWEELNIDHRQPNTFSIIIDRFLEVNDINLSKLQYTKSEDNKIQFLDEELANRFRQYHRDKANLRIVRKENNLSRSHQARIKQQKKDLKIEKHPPLADN